VPNGRYLVDDGGRVVYATEALWKFDAPKAQLFRLIIDGTLGGRLPWGLVLIGVFLALMMELLGVSSLPFAVGLYLPIYTSAGIFVGGCMRWLVDRKRRAESTSEAEFSPGVLMASGLIAGGAIAGVVQAVIAYGEKDDLFAVGDWIRKYAGDPDHPVYSSLAAIVSNDSWWPMVPFLAMAAGLYWIGSRSASGGAPKAPPANPDAPRTEEPAPLAKVGEAKADDAKAEAKADEAKADDEKKKD